MHEAANRSGVGFRTLKQKSKTFLLYLYGNVPSEHRAAFKVHSVIQAFKDCSTNMVSDWQPLQTVW